MGSFVGKGNHVVQNQISMAKGQKNTISHGFACKISCDSTPNPQHEILQLYS